MDSRKISACHPSFAHIIKQLSNDDAKIMQKLKDEQYNYIPIIDIEEELSFNNYKTLISTISSYGKSIDIDANKVQSIIVNLDRLGIIEIEKDKFITIENGYKDTEELVNLYISENYKNKKEKINLKKYLACTTTFGESFINSCTN